MDSNVWLVASVWMGLALLASIISIRIGISVALIEILVGILAGNFLGIHSAPWIDFLATFGAGLLTFLAGAEIDPASLRRHLTPALAIGTLSFAIPFVAAGLFAYRVAGWDRNASYIAVIALSTTSVAVVYAVMVETGLNRTELGKLILASCFVTDFGTVLALGAIFANFNGWLALFVAVTAGVLWYLPRLTRFVIKTVGHRVSEPEVKFVFLVLFQASAGSSFRRLSPPPSRHIERPVVGLLFLSFMRPIHDHFHPLESYQPSSHHFIQLRKNGFDLFFGLDALDHYRKLE